MIRFAAVLGLLIAATASHAACKWVYDCSSGQCKQVPICTNTFDQVPVKPLSVPPIVPPSITPIMPPTVPPVGTQACHPMRVCNPQGQCSWQQVCQ